jgi:hypothetical protein
MLRKSLRLGTAFLLAALGAACASTETQKSTGTNWISCKSDVDCTGHPDTHCGSDEKCVAGPPWHSIPPNIDAGSGGGASGDDSGALNGGGMNSSGGAEPGGEGGTTGSGGGTTGSGGKGSEAPTGCYSPGQNLTTSFDPRAVGCRCIESEVPNGLCMKTPNNGAGAYRCQTGHWQAIDAQDGPCSGCWTPDEPEFANAFPDKGCDCVNENETTCIVTQGDGYTNAVCKGGTWKLDPTLNSCTCTADTRCGFGGKCVNGSCAPRACEVDGVRYAMGVSFPSPLDSCNTCECSASGDLQCTLIECTAPSTACATNTIQTRTCVGCGPVGGCTLWRYGCLPQCETNTPCGGTELLVCNTTTHVCDVGPCF